MSSDSPIPNLEQNSALSDAEFTAKSTAHNVNAANLQEESNSIIPDAELDSVLLYLKSNSDSGDGEHQAARPDEQPNSTPSDVESRVAKTENVESNLDLLNLDGTDFVENQVKNDIQVHFKTEEGRLLVILPTELQVPATEFAWSDIWQQLKFRLMAGDRLRTPNTFVHLIAHDRLLDTRQLQQLAETFGEVQLQLKSVATSRRQTAIAAVTSGYSVEQLQPETILSSEPKATATPQADALYLEMTIRSGMEIRHPGTVILLGDINPGGMVLADGDIIVWGRLRGIAHAGASGNSECLIMALHMEPTQLRIADAVARSPEKLPTQFFPEVAHITSRGIRIVRANDFSRNLLNRINQAP
ncbi:septum site-determining protein MinC [Anabaena sp. UHCC 0399]|uniref:septum site-determining protein MinC n=1 Tax=Anabaena sp. UHCC 0399 TaxID=3110238 RepID=UPI002B1F265D|nr:septum site-determining protein MinC [Anabaena sp. UHCC 0399]MEA5568973.1 septum site-determining protein MinC [Anabaena sp. UHCC 0399]